MINGTLTDEELERTLGVAYQDSANADEIIKKAAAYVREKAGATATAEPEATATVNPLATEGRVEYPQEESGGSAAGWLIGGALLIAGGGGAYAWYANLQRKRAAAQRLAQKRAAQQRAGQGQAAGKAPISAQNRPGNNAAGNRQPAGGAFTPRPGSSGNPSAAGGTPTTKQGAPAQTAGGVRAGETAGAGGVKTVSAQSAARVRTGSYTEQNGSTRPRPAAGANTTGAQSQKPYGKPMDNPYGRYTSDAEEDATYTASFKPSSRENSSSPRRRRNHSGQTGENNESRS
jgi:hypothetical protein